MRTIDDVRPCFFRFGDGRPYSGYRHVRTGDIWAHIETIADVVKELTTTGYALVAAANADPQGNEWNLAIVKHATQALDMCERLEFINDVDLFPLDYVQKNERCHVARVDRVSGAVHLFLEFYHARLTDSSNCLIIEPHTSDDVLPHLALYVDPIKGHRASRLSVVA